MCIPTNDGQGHMTCAAISCEVEVHTVPYFLFVTADMERPSTAGCSQIVQIMHTILRQFQVRVVHKWHS